MGRASYGEEERRKVITSFIRVTREIIDVEGIEQVSIRKIAAMNGFNCATIYLYFSNVDELINLACMSYLEKYCRTLAADMPLMKTSMAAYRHTWELFCNYAFTYPKVFYQLFFKNHKKPLKETIELYYRLYPQLLSDLSEEIREMLQEGTLQERCMKVLKNMVAEGIMKQEHAELINDLSVCYFRQLLEQRCADSEGSLQGVALTKQFMAALDLLLRIK